MIFVAGILYAIHSPMTKIRRWPAIVIVTFYYDTLAFAIEIELEWDSVQKKEKYAWTICVFFSIRNDSLTMYAIPDIWTEFKICSYLSNQKQTYIYAERMLI